MDDVAEGAHRGMTVQMEHTPFVRSNQQIKEIDFNKFLVEIIKQ